MKKKVLGITLSLAVGLSTQFVQVDSLLAGDMAQAVGMQQAEAGFSVDKLKKKGMKKLEKKALEKGSKEVNKAVKKEVNKALTIDMDNLNGRIRSMKAHLNLATSFTAAAQYQLLQAAALQGSSNFDEIGTISNNTRTNFNDLGASYRYAEISGVDAGIGSQIETRLNSSDANVKEDAKKWVAYSKESRSMSAWYKALAAKDASYVIKESDKGLAKVDYNGGGHQEEVKLLKHYKDVAKDTQAICDNIGNKDTVMDKAVKSVEAKCNVKAPTKERQQQIAHSVLPE